MTAFTPIRYFGQAQRLCFFLFAMFVSLAWSQTASLTPSEQIFAQKIGIDPATATPEQVAKARSMLGGRDPSSLSEEEIGMARQAVTDAKMKGALKDGSSASGGNQSARLDAGPTLVQQETALAEHPEERFVPPPSKGLRRYEIDYFARALPTAFYDLQTAVAPDYPIKPGDNLVLTLWGMVERETRLVVNSQGKVNIEGVGLVSLNNLNLAEAQELLRGRLKSVYGGIGKGTVFVNLRPESISATKVFVMGGVAQPGGYDLPGNSNVFLALYRAKGPSEIGSVRSIQITRTNGDKSEVDLYDLLFKGQKPKDAILKDGDVVFLPRARKIVAIDGDVGQRAIYELKEHEGVKELLDYAGRANPSAKHSIQLTRIMPDGKRDVLDLDSPDLYAGGKSYPLMDGDALFVRGTDEFGRRHFSVIGPVWYPGKYELKDGATVAHAISVAGGLRPDAKAGRVIVRRILPDSTFTFLSDPMDSTVPSLPLQEGDQIDVLSSVQLKAKDSVYVVGAVKRPLTVLWQSDMTAQSLIALAGGFSPNHIKGRIRIEHLVPGRNEVKVEEIDIRDDLVAQPNERKLQPGDRIVIPVDPAYYQQEVVTLSGAFQSPGQYSLLRKRESFKELMDRAGLLDPNAFPRGGRLFRKRGSDKFQVNFDLADALKGKTGGSLALQDGDEIFIPFEQLTVQVKGDVVSPGDVLWVKGMDLEDYLDAAGGLTQNGDEDRVMITYANGKKATIKRADLDPDPGSVIFVPYKKEEPTDWYKVWGTVAAIVGALAQTAIALIVATK